jgi:ABC-type uncharacterized transport system permease subunit
VIGKMARGSGSAKAISYLCVIILTIITIALIVLPFGYNPLTVFGALLQKGFGNLKVLSNSINIAIPILFCGLASVVAFRSGMWNVGQEGQLLLGALGAVMLGLTLKLPIYLHLPVVIIASFVFGSIWALIPALLKAYFKSNEIITTLLMNFIAIGFTAYFINYHLRGALSTGARTDMIGESAKLPILFINGWSTPHAGLILVIIFCFLIGFLLKHTVTGFRLKAVGMNQEAAFYGGINKNRAIFTSLGLSGGLAGMAGMCQVSGVIYFLTADGISFNYGYFGIMVALIGKLNIKGVAIASFIIGGMLNGGRAIQMSMAIPSTIVIISIALFSLSLLLQKPIENKFKSILLDKKGLIP